jgi:hypothetical protein
MFRAALRWLYYLPSDCWDRLSGQRLPMVPPQRLNFVGSKDFLSVGDT